MLSASAGSRMCDSHGQNPWENGMNPSRGEEFQFDSDDLDEDDADHERRDH